MRLDVESRNRLGITHEVLAVFAHHELDVRAVDMVTNHTYIDVPDLTMDTLLALEPDILGIAGVGRMIETDMLPSERRRAQLSAVLSAIAEPVLAADMDGTILIANRTASSLLGVESGDDLIGQSLLGHVDDVAIHDVLKHGFRSDDREVQVRGDTFLMHATPFGLDDGNTWTSAGGVLVFQSRARLGRIVAALQSQGVEGFDAIIGDTVIMQQVKERAARLAQINAPLLIQGETGTGKELFARACHSAGDRRDGPFIALNCAALPESLAESELFGYDKGAFTGANKSGKPGLLELADGGTIFLDEVGELTSYLQAKLLRFIQDGTYRRIGGESEKHVDVRIISATNRDLSRMAEKSEFRSDLLFRLNVLTIQTPSLREHTQDIPALARAFVARSAARIGRPPPRLSRGAMELLTEVHWPGNVRELENVIFRSVSLHEGQLIQRSHLSFDNNQVTAESQSVRGTLKRCDYKNALESFESDFFQAVASEELTTRQLAEQIGLSHTTVARKLKKYSKNTR